MDDTQTTDDEIDTEPEADEDEDAPYVRPCRYCGGRGYRTETILRGPWAGSEDRIRCRFCEDY